MKAARVAASLEELLAGGDAAWRGVPEEVVALEPTILAMQPSGYIQTKWKDSGHGAIAQVRVSAAHNGDDLCFRLAWEDETDDGQPDDMSKFPDQAAVMLPIKEDASMMEMGSPELPVNMWLWRGDAETPYYVTSTGRGTSIRHRESPLAGRAMWEEGRWRVVIARPFHVSLPAGIVVPLAPGITHRCTFAVWQGSTQERGGLKAFQRKWQKLEIEA